MRGCGTSWADDVSPPKRERVFPSRRPWRFAERRQLPDFLVGEDARAGQETDPLRAFEGKALAAALDHIEIGGCPFYIRENQFEYWRHTQLIIDVVKGGGEGFSLEGPEGISFLTRSRVFTDEEVGELAARGEPPRAA